MSQPNETVFRIAMYLKPYNCGVKECIVFHPACILELTVPKVAQLIPFYEPLIVAPTIS